MTTAAALALDLAEIAQLIQRYGKALDDKDYDLLDQVFAPGAVTTYQLDEIGSDTSWPAMRKQFEQFNSAFFSTSHLISHPLITLDGDRALAESRLIATHVQLRHDDSRSSWFVFGFYRDELTRTAGGWRITRRVFRGTHTEGTLLPHDQVKRFDRPPWRP